MRTQEYTNLLIKCWLRAYIISVKGDLKYICDGIDQVFENYVDKTTEIVNNFLYIIR